MASVRLHVSIENRRTTITMPRVLADLLQRHLRGGLGAVRAWAQTQIDSDPEAFVGGASQRLAHLGMLAIAAPGLRRAYEAAILDTEISRRPQRGTP